MHRESNPDAISDRLNILITMEDKRQTFAFSPSRCTLLPKWDGSHGWFGTPFTFANATFVSTFRPVLRRVLRPQFPTISRLLSSRIKAAVPFGSVSTYLHNFSYERERTDRCNWRGEMCARIPIKRKISARLEETLAIRRTWFFSCDQPIRFSVDTALQTYERFMHNPHQYCYLLL